MSSPVRLRRRRTVVGWVVLAAALVGALVVLVRAARSDDDSSGLPAADPAQLVSAARAGTLPPFAGTAVAQISSDVAVVGEMARASTPASGMSLAGLSAGSHTLRIWHGATGQARVAFVRARSETDWFRSGQKQWQWDSADRVAVRGVPAPATSVWTATATPADLARQLLQARDTDIELAGSETVADRKAYALVLRPSAPSSLIDSVYLAVDAATRAPLAVQIYAKDSGEAAVDVSFTTIRFAAQPNRVFTFRPPNDATVRTVVPAAATTVGTGWSPVLCFRVDDPADVASTALNAVAGVSTASTVSTVKGRWGRGHLLALPLLSVLVVDDGRTYAGPVVPSSLYAVAIAERPGK